MSDGKKRGNFGPYDVARYAHTSFSDVLAVFQDMIYRKKEFEWARFYDFFQAILRIMKENNARGRGTTISEHSELARDFPEETNTLLLAVREGEMTAKRFEEFLAAVDWTLNSSEEERNTRWEEKRKLEKNEKTEIFGAATGAPDDFFPRDDYRNGQRPTPNEIAFHIFAAENFNEKEWLKKHRIRFEENPSSR